MLFSNIVTIISWPKVCPILLPLPVCKLLDFKVTSQLITLKKSSKIIFELISA